jgi:hypothetical protein
MVYADCSAYWMNCRGDWCSDILNRRWRKAWKSGKHAKADWYAGQQNERMMRSECQAINYYGLLTVA